MSDEIIKNVATPVTSVAANVGGEINLGGIGRTFVEAYTRADGTRVSGYYRGGAARKAVRELFGDVLTDNGYDASAPYQTRNDIIANRALQEYRRETSIYKVSDKKRISDDSEPVTSPKLPESYEIRKNTWNKKPDLESRQELVFDGQRLTLYEDGKKAKSWKGISGRDGFQTKNYQYTKNKGPLPEGVHVARRSDYQEWNDQSSFDQVISNVSGYVPFGLGKWNGGKRSWGEQRVWLEPSKQSDMKGRSNFSIHGGANPGSAGCIDLTAAMSDFAKWYKNNGKDVVIKVKYAD